MLENYVKHSIQGIIHTNIKSNHAKTGRQSSSNPNLQNVSKANVQQNPFPVPARKVFVNFKNSVLNFADYAGQELILIIEI